MPSWALQYILALLFSTANLCFSSAFIWRCEDDPAIIEKYGNHKFDFVSDDIRDKMIAYDEAQGNLTLRDLADSMTAEKMLESTDSDNPVFDGDGLTDLDEGMPVDEDRELFLRFDPSSKNAAWFRGKFETVEVWKNQEENQAPGKDVLEAFKEFEDEYVKKSKGENIVPWHIKNVTPKILTKMLRSTGTISQKTEVKTITRTPVGDNVTPKIL